jgi:hypothetical protein
MIDKFDVSPEFRPFYLDGERLREDLLKWLNELPLAPNLRVDEAALSEFVSLSGEELRERAQRWFNLLAVNVLPYTAFERNHLTLLMRRVLATTNGKVFHEEYHHDAVNFLSAVKSPYTEHNVEIAETLEVVHQEAQTAMNEALRLIRSAPAPSKMHEASRTPSASTAHITGTAFVLMWMDPERHDLVDVHITIRDICSEFGIVATRADDIEHQGRITDVVLRQIASSEFIIADLTGGRPNVYYELGYAHALGKRPILLRRSGTPLHFDIAGYNVPEYTNITNLKDRLRKRLASMTGKDAMQ